MDHYNELRNFNPEHEFFIGIDSDGCVFDSMEKKQKEFFIPAALKYFGLSGIEQIAREKWEFVNLYSIHRGGNRFKSMIKVFDLLSADKQVAKSGIKLPSMKALKEWVNKENRLGNETLRKYYENNPDPDLGKVLEWSESINEEISRRLKNVPPFPSAPAAIEMISSKADIVIVSQTPLEALKREWNQHGLTKYVKMIAGQEHGTKSEHLALAAKGKYPDDNILMIGDAKGDLDAAVNNRILFYPVIPGKEDISWKQFSAEGFQKFTEGSFRGEYQEKLIQEFVRALPEKLSDVR